MERKEKRKYQRVEICGPISYLCKDSKGNVLEQNMGIARNVSQAGIQIETFQEIESEYITLICSDLNKFQIEANGKVIYCKRNNSGQFNVGIKLQETAERNICLIKALLKTYFYGKSKTRLKISPAAQN